ncbi:hypothetical protein B0A48_17577 [Cryoendolithus antarcticus]|uniref:DOD-type homing endonuclease domain-containing protein n=1 Tax=Cryoendolithus antarcticus TaxID=1507870 RepID=A0A1V8SBX8_9PEZI|nr:hypothetical protein B0A48_17577 [Cryoendolithus antarcticus]
MKRISWRILPPLLLLFWLFIAAAIASDPATDADIEADETYSHSLLPSESARWTDQTRPSESNDYRDNAGSNYSAVGEATVILRKIKPASISKLTQYARKPKGVVGSTMYYAKEAFVLLFMNSPRSENLISTTPEPSPKNLAQPLAMAVRILEEAADGGDVDSIFLLAEMNFYGNYTHPVNHSEAFRRYKQLADLNGNSTAQSMLGFMYATGIAPAVPADQAKSMLYHTFAAEQGNTRSEMTLGYRYHAGIATPRNCDESVNWYRRVADKAIDYYRSGPPGGHSLGRSAYRIADDAGGVFGEGASVSSAGVHAKQGGPTSDAYAEAEDVLEYLHFQSSKGILSATFGLARLHYDGSRGLTRDYKLAKTYFMELARQYWDPKGRVKTDLGPGVEKLASKSAGYLGRMFLRGEGMEQSYSKAKIWFTRGVANGDALSQYSLGLMHLEGLGVEQNVKKAADYFGSAADQDLAVAQTNLGILFLDQGDITTATRYFELAARNSHIEAFYYLAELNNEAIGRERSCSMAAMYYKIVAEKAEAIWSPVSEANTAYEEGDTSRALLVYLLAAEQGSENAQANVAWLLDHTPPQWSPLTYLLSWLGSSSRSESATSDANLALTHYTRSAKQNNIDSLVKTGDYHLSGLGLASSLPSPETAAACYAAATETQQSALALWNLGWMHENGLGIAQDFHLAKRYYDAALETHREAYLPVHLSLIKLRARSWWNGVTHGGVNPIDAPDASDSTGPKKKRTVWEWMEDFLQADAKMTALEQQEADDWDAAHEHHSSAGGEEFWAEGEDVDDEVLVTLLLGGLIAVLAGLVWWRQREARRLAAQQAALQGGQPPAEGQQQVAQGQQGDGGFFPHPGEPGWNDWVAGGVGH